MSRNRSTGLLGALLAAALLAGCGSGSRTLGERGSATPAPTLPRTPASMPAQSTTPFPSSLPSTLVSQSAIGPPSPTAARTPESRRATATLSDQDKGGTISIARGASLRVVLHSTYWAFDAPSAPGVVQADGDEQLHPAPYGSCVPGQGCGTVEQWYRAVSSGSAVLGARRSSCGEALACSGDNGHWSVTIRVS